MFKDSANYKKLILRAETSWQIFQNNRSLRLKQHEREGGGAEKIAENIIEDLLTTILDWCISEINYQIGYSDLLLTENSIKRLIIEVKRPASLKWNKNAIQCALEQARRYADTQQVKTIAVSDGHMFYAADIRNGGIKDRLFVDLSESKFPVDLWWISKHGIYRERNGYKSTLTVIESTSLSDASLIHPKYAVPAHCFAYVGDSSKPSTWKLPYMLQDGSIDLKRLPKAISAIISNYRGTKVKDIPEKAIFDVLHRLKVAAEKIGKMPYQNPKTSNCYQQLEEILAQVT